MDGQRTANYYKELEKQSNTGEVAITGEVTFDEVQARRDEIMEIIGNKLNGPSFGLEFNVPNFVCSGIFQKISGDRIFLKDATQVEICLLYTSPSPRD